MDKSKIIDDILMEWAMRSPDGLVGGHDTPENAIALVETLVALGEEFDEAKKSAKELTGNSSVDDLEDPAPGRIRGGKRPASLFLFKDASNRRRILVYNRDIKAKPDYEDGDEYPYPVPSGVLQTLHTNTEKNINAARKILGLEIDPMWRTMRNAKKVSSANVERFRAALDLYKKQTDDQKSIDKFLSMFDSLDIQEAIKVYSGNGKYSDLIPLIDFIDDGTAHAPTGRGEMVFVFILKNMTSGGNQKMDLVIAEAVGKEQEYGSEQGIEVKETTNKIIGISAPTLHGYSTSLVNRAIHELVVLIHRHKDAGLLDALLGILRGGRGASRYEAYSSALKKFFDDPKSGEISMDLLTALFIVSARIRNRSGNEKSGAKMDIVIGDKETEFAITNPSQIRAALDSVEKEKSSGRVKMNIGARHIGTGTSESIENVLKKSIFFREKLTPRKIRDEVTKLLTNKYSKLLVVDKSDSSAQRATLYDKSTMHKLKFAYIGFGKLYLAMPGATRDQIKTSQNSGGEQKN